MDYSITWSYIVGRMKTKFGISSKSNEKFSMHEIEAYLDDIWSEYVWELNKRQIEIDRADTEGEYE